MRRPYFQASLVLASLLFASTLVGCRGGHGLRVAISTSPAARPTAVRVFHGGTVRDKLLPFSVSGTRRFQDEVATDPLRRTNAPLEAVLGSSHELAQAIANHGRSDLKLAPFATAPELIKPEPAAEDIATRPSQRSHTEEVERSEDPASASERELTIAGEAQVEAELPSAEAFARERRFEPAQELNPSEIQQPEKMDEQERLREARIQQLLDLLAKAEEQAAASVAPPVPQAPIMERAEEHKGEVVEPQIIPQKVEAPQEIVLRATATMPYQSIRNERVELLNVQQLAPTIPARPGLPAVVQRPPLSGEAPRGWANQDWSRELMPDFSDLGTAAPQEVQFTPLPAVQQPGSSSQTAEAGPSGESQPSHGRIVPELDTNPATAARPIQKPSERR